MKAHVDQDGWRNERQIVRVLHLKN